MSTRAIQSELLLAGFRDPLTDEPLNGGSVEFRAAGTTDPKNAWPNKDKTSPATSVTLEADGTALMYFDGIYDFVVKNSSGEVKHEPTYLKHQSPTQSVKTVVANYTATVDDDVILTDTTGGAITVTLYPVEDSVASVTIKNIGNEGNAVTVDGDGTDLINGNATATLVDGAAQEYFSDLSQWFGAATTTGTAYTSDNLIAGTNVTLVAGSGVTNINVATASETVKGVIEKATDAEAITGTSTDLATTPANLAAVVVDKKLNLYQSAGQVITTAGPLVLPHGLAVEPVDISIILQNTTAEHNYLVGDRIAADLIVRGLSVVVDATNITIRYNDQASVFVVYDKTTGAGQNATNTSWQMYVNARG